MGGPAGLVHVQSSLPWQQPPTDQCHICSANICLPRPSLIPLRTLSPFHSPFFPPPVRDAQAEARVVISFGLKPLGRAQPSAGNSFILYETKWKHVGVDTILPLGPGTLPYRRMLNILHWGRHQTSQPPFITSGRAQGFIWIQQSA